jgi:hypothetical protein
VRLIYKVEENRHSLVLDPLVDSLIHGFLLAADHPYRDALAARAARGRPAAVRDATDHPTLERHAERESLPK